jgi:hypothetical protein
MYYNLIVAVNQQWTSTNAIKKNPTTKHCVCVSAGVVDRPCMDLLCKLSWKKTFRYTEWQKVSYTPTHLKEKKMATLFSKTQSKRNMCVWVCVYVCICMCVYIYIYIHTHTHTHTHTHMYTYTQTYVWYVYYDMCNFNLLSFILGVWNYAYTTHLHLASRLRISK